MLLIGKPLLKKSINSLPHPPKGSRSGQSNLKFFYMGPEMIGYHNKQKLH